MEQSAKRRKHRQWLALLVFAALIAAPFAPKFPLWFGIVLLVLCVATFFPGVQALSRRLLRLNPAEKWSGGIRLTMYGLIALVLILAGSIGAEYNAGHTRIATQQAAEKAEQRSLSNEANAQVVAVVREAEAAWKDDDSALAEKKLEAASRIPNATELATIRRLRNRMANAKVDALMAEATKAVKAGDIRAGRKKVHAAIAVPHADNLAEPRRLDQQIRNATDLARIRTGLMELPDEEFLQLEEYGLMPEQLLSGYEGLDSRAAGLAKAQLAGVAVAREQRRQEQLERERAEAEAVRKTEEERKARSAARRQRRQEQIEREQAAAVAARKTEEARKARSATPAPQPTVPAQTKPGAPMPAYAVVDRDTYDAPIKTQITLHAVVSGTVTELGLKQLLQKLHNEANATRGFKYHGGKATHVAIYLYTSRDHFKSRMAQWIAMLSRSGRNARVDTQIKTYLISQIAAKPEVKHGIRESKRKRIFMAITRAEDRADAEAWRMYPLLDSLKPLEKLAEALDKLTKKYKAEVAKRYGLTKEQLLDISVEGLQKNWPFPLIETESTR